MRSRRRSLRSVAPGFVAADDRKQAHVGAQRGRVARDVRRPAGAFFDTVYLHDRHRRLGGNAGDFAEPVAVEHDIADDEYTRCAAPR